mgnify:CR=1 FL=1
MSATRYWVPKRALMLSGIPQEQPGEVEVVTATDYAAVEAELRHIYEALREPTESGVPEGYLQRAINLRTERDALRDRLTARTCEAPLETTVQIAQACDDENKQLEARPAQAERVVEWVRQRVHCLQGGSGNDPCRLNDQPDTWCVYHYLQASAGRHRRGKGAA